jgi:N-acetylmuramoyl-L-alanine amidase
MMPFLAYLLKTIICSGLFFSYYRIALYNRSFHRLNRFYLLGSVIVSLIIPFIHIHLSGPLIPINNQVIQLLDVVNSDNNGFHEMDVTNPTTTGILTLVTALYLLLSGMILFVLLFNLYKLWLLYYNNPKERIDRFNLILATEKNTPFSFFRNIYWNPKIELSSPEGCRIWKHEVSHAVEMHSADRLFMSFVLVVFWCNPFYWLARKELNLVHEFLADRNTIRDHDLKAFSEMILYAAFPKYRAGLTSNFSSSSIKRRLLMLTNLKKQQSNYIGRLLILPVIIAVTGIFAIRMGNNSHAVIPVVKSITVVIDAGHGGERSGAVAADGTLEKDLNLAIAKKIAGLNSNENIKIMLTRASDVTHPSRELVDETVKKQPDAFISIHVNTGSLAPSGFEMYVSEKNVSFEKQSRLLGTLITNQIESIFQVAPELKKGAGNGNGIWVLDAPTINYPAILIECGNLSNKTDLAFLKNPDNQDKIAEKILNAIALYANSTEK